MEITPLVIRRKLALYNKKPSVRVILDDPTLLLYFDGSLYRPLLGEQVDGDALATFPNGWTLDAQGGSDLPEVDPGLLGGQLVFAPADLDDETPNRLLYLADDENSTLDAVDAIFGDGSWSVFLCLNDLEAMEGASAALDFNDGNQGGFRIEVQADTSLKVFYKGSELGAEEFETGVFDGGPDCWICVRKDGNEIEALVNGTVIGSQTLDAPSGLNIIQGAIGGRFSSSTIDTVLLGKLSMLAVFTDAISGTQLGRLKRRAQLINKSVVFAEPDQQNELPSFRSLPELTGGALPEAPVVGDELTVGSFEVAGFPEPVVSYQWTADGLDIAGADEASYTVLVGDIGKVLACEVSAENVEGGVTEASPDTLEVVAA